jgi:hypothetical protein
LIADKTENMNRNFIGITRKEWAERKIAIANRLYRGECGGSYGEAVMILSAVLSALAADLWPGSKKDKARFVQLLVEFAPANFNVKRISVPLLVAYCRTTRELFKECEILRKTFLNYPEGVILDGDEVDKSETEILESSTNLDIKAVRLNSYACLLYSEIRSGYVHEYKPGQLSEPSPMTQKETSISYVNWACKTDKHIHFHIPWLSSLVLSVAEMIDLKAEGLSRPMSEEWWLFPRM